MFIFIGEKESTGRGSGSAAIKQFLVEHVFEKFGGCLVATDKTNKVAISAYEKAGFVRFKKTKKM